jgi:iron complex transport system substrate-binding protein
MNAVWRSLCGCLFLSLAVPAAAACPRIVSQSPYITEALEWLGQGACIVGVSRYDKRALPHTGGVKDPDLGAIAALDPQLILVSKGTDPATLDVFEPDARVVQVDGFGSMAETETLLRTLAAASGVADAEARVAAYARDWRARAAAVGGKGARVLVISACSAQPYSFGRGHVVGDAFVHAGFDVVETADRIRHLRAGEEVEGIVAAVERFKPDLLFSLTPENAEHCSAELGLVAVPVIGLEGRHFFHPGPALVAGFTELAEHMKQ